MGSTASSVTATYNLNGGTLATDAVYSLGYRGSNPKGISVFNFNGGTLQENAAVPASADLYLYGRFMGLLT